MTQKTRGPKRRIIEPTHLTMTVGAAYHEVLEKHAAAQHTSMTAIVTAFIETLPGGEHLAPQKSEKPGDGPDAGRS